MTRLGRIIFKKMSEVNLGQIEIGVSLNNLRGEIRKAVEYKCSVGMARNIWVKACKSWVMKTNTYTVI
jgi:hypothetical protein